MVAIILSITPFQVTYRVVLLAFILVVHLRQTFRIGDKRLGHKAMNLEKLVFPILAKASSQVATSVHLRL